MSFILGLLRKNLWDSQFIRQWRAFFSIILNPFVIILLLATGVLIYVTVKSSPDIQEIKNVRFIEEILMVVTSIFAGIAGAVISSRWKKLSETSVLVTRGKSAIRGLNLLLLNLKKLEERIIICLSRLGGNVQKVIPISYEEFAHTCRQLQEEAINAIEEWQDIIPEANVKTQIGVITDLKTQLIELNGEITEIKEKYSHLEQYQEDEKVQLNNEIKEKEGELVKLRGKLRDKRIELGGTVLGGLSGSGSYYMPAMAGDLTSIKMSDLTKISINDPAISGLSRHNICPICGLLYIGDKCLVCGFGKTAKKDEK